MSFVRQKYNYLSVEGDGLKKRKHRRKEAKKFLQTQCKDADKTESQSEYSDSDSSSDALDFQDPMLKDPNAPDSPSETPTSQDRCKYLSSMSLNSNHIHIELSGN
jgi:hypothetical protein